MAKPTPVAGLKPETPLAGAAFRLLGARLRDVKGRLRAAAGGRSSAGVHELRVACRRLRVALVLLGGDQGRSLAGRLKELQDALGLLRDLHLQDPWLRRTQLPRFLAERGAQLESRAAALDKALRELRGSTAPAIERARRAGPGAGRLGGKRMRRALEKSLLKLKRRLRSARSAKPDAAHRLRIAAKRLRYQLELLEPGFAGAAKAGLEELEPLQDALGELHDADARACALSAFLDGASEAEVPPALAALTELMAERDELADGARREIRRWKRMVRRLRRALDQAHDRS